LIRVSGFQDEIAFASAGELAARIRRRELSPVELVDATLARIAELNPRLRAFLTVCASQAREEARAAEHAQSRGEELGPLHGVPFSVKDLEWTAGVRTTYGSKRFEENVPAEDSTGVARLRAAGAILIGKTNTPEFGLLGEVRNLLGEDGRNPWDASRTCGGSSGGAAAAVAAGLGSLAVGSDGAGSITAPASFCGAVGLKPSTGRIPAWPVGTTSRMFVATGPITRTVEDAALALSIMAGPDGRDPISHLNAMADVRAAVTNPPERVRVAWTPDLGHFPVDHDVLTACIESLGAFRDLGWDVLEQTPVIENPWGPYLPLFLGDEWISLGEQVIRDPLSFHPDALEEIEPGRGISLRAYIRALNEQSRLRGALDEFFTRFDVLCMPTTATTAFPVGDAPRTIGGMPVNARWTSFMPFPVTWNMGNNPVVSVPCGLTPEGLPVGLLVVARVGREDVAVAAARVIEASQSTLRPAPLDASSAVAVDQARWI
jgi:Asp-tRNA(Asn)/Glu-tRNA(Gln) amidotransferase A subunit family amidase